ncbi:MAG TPA: alpha/beta hydrolase [Acidimicrobiales bacterium]
MGDVARGRDVGYDEFGMLHENAEEAGLPFDAAAPPAVERVWVDVGGGRELSAIVWGDGPPELVLLHGGAQNAHTWDTVALALRPRSLVAIDLPGHGHSADARATDGSSAVAAAEDVAPVIRTLAPDATAVVGMSFGGLTAIALAGLAPELVRSLGLVDVLPGLASKNAAHIMAFVSGPPAFASFDELLERTVQFNPHRSRSSLRRGILHNAARQPDGTWVWRHSRGPAGAAGRVAGIKAQGDQLYGDLWASLEAAAGRGPVLLCRGLREDSVLRDGDVDELRRRVPSAQVVDFPGAGHSIQGDQPVALAATLADLLD